MGADKLFVVLEVLVVLGLVLGFACSCKDYCVSGVGSKMFEK